MFKPKERPEYQFMLEGELVRVIRNLKTESVPTEEYAKTLTLVERIHEMMDYEKPSSVSKETLVTIAANLVGLVLIISHEHVGNVITSKALNFVLRAR